MNYYNEIKKELVNNEINRKVKSTQLIRVIWMHITMLEEC